MEKTYHILGLMSGSSLDGLDLAFCRFSIENQGFSTLKWKILKAEMLPYSEQWVSRLLHLPHQNALILAKTHTYFGRYMAEMVNEFLSKHELEPDFIASHGHTVFHYPENHMTLQVGEGAALAALTGYPVISDFRTQDVALGGEGAPLAPLADKYLLPGYDFYLNLGGIANISCNIKGRIVAFDVAPANQILNALANEKGLPFDRDGELASTGVVDEGLLSLLNKINYYTLPYPKSMDNQWVVTEVLPHIKESRLSTENKLRTFVEHISVQIASSIEEIKTKEGFDKTAYSLIPSGGGALNLFLMERVQANISKKNNLDLISPGSEIIEFKEAALMALLGLLRILNIPNSLSSVTGAKLDTVNGCVYQGRKKEV